jgi:hypothetical protein
MSNHPISGAFASLEKLITLLLVLVIVFVPLGIWKMVEIIIWLYKHISVTIK